LEDLSAVHLARLAFLAALHDVGKVNAGFQLKAHDNPPFKAGHVKPVVALLGGGPYAAVEHLRSVLPFGEMQSWFGDSSSGSGLLMASICHHGRPHRPGGTVQPHLWTPDALGRDPFADMEHLVRSAREWYPDAFSAEHKPLPTDPLFQHFYAGLVNLADWIGSDERFFPYSMLNGADDADRYHHAKRYATFALRHIGLDASRAQGFLSSVSLRFPDIFPGGYQPRPVQQATIDLPMPQGGSVVVLESETGSGKTEAALARFVLMFQEGLVDGLYFALPTRTSATQMHRRVSETVQHLFRNVPSEDRPPVLLAVPGYVRVDDVEGHLLPSFEVRWPDDEQERYRYRGWAAENPKRFLGGAIVVGTVDQVLLSVLMVPHAHLRSAALLRHLLVVDEVHASDAYMTTILRTVLANHVAAGGHAFLMSATLGNSACATLLRSAGARDTAKPLEEAADVPFPRVAIYDSGRDYSDIGVAAASSKLVEAELSDIMNDPDAVAGIALAAASAGARVLVIRNTVAACVETQRALERMTTRSSLLWTCGGVIATHHSIYAREDRFALDGAIEDAFGKGQRPTDHGMVAVATQTVQQSLDLDADFMVTDLCPMDVLLQRLGRLHRHHRQRPQGFRTARVLVLRPRERDLGSLIRTEGWAPGPVGIGTVYGDLRVLETTLRCLEHDSKLIVPGKNRHLVESTTHPEALTALVDELGGRWRNHQNYILGSDAADSGAARVNLVDFEAGYWELEFPTAKLARKIRTRLGEGDRIARFATELTSPFGNTLRQIKIPASQALDVPVDAETTLLETNGSRTLFTFGTHQYEYTRLGLGAVQREG
jgi:CRISPR-associated endonuclease/helicase Cas3